jgi:superfamily I DNA/RNA helicase
MGWKRRTVAVKKKFEADLTLYPGSDQQEAIWDRLLRGKRHIMVQALAGTGKTFSVCQGLIRLGEAVGDAAFVAFNKAIAAELHRKVPEWVEASTLHSLLYKVVREYYGKVQLEDYKSLVILEDLMGEAVYEKTPYVFKLGVEKLVSLCKNTLVTPTPENLAQVCDRYDVDFGENGEGAFELATQILDMSKGKWFETYGLIDFDDMIWLPVINGLKMPKKDLLAVDEAQDLNACQQAAIQKIGKRLLLVGDENQAIYGFRGADTESMARMASWMESTKRGVDVLPLTLTRRCPKSHVVEAAKIVPNFEAMPEAPEGIWEDMDYESALNGVEPGDLVVCRLNAPVVAMAFKLLLAGVPANIQGRDIGAGLKALLKSKSGKGCSVSLLMRRLRDYLDRERFKLLGQKRVSKTKIQALEDRVECLLMFCDGAETVEEVLEKIDDMFKDARAGDKRFVLLSSVHRAKGLEAETVWILYPELMPFAKAELPWEIKQEWNLRYVAMTRSKRRMVLVPLSA